MKSNEKHLHPAVPSSFKWSETCGSRLKELANNHVPKLRLRDMAELLHYAKTQSISNLYNGETKYIDVDRLKSLEKLFGVWSRYLLCESDYKTEAEMLQAAHSSDLLQYKTILEYLETIGLKAVPYVYLVVNDSNVGEIIERYSDYIADGERERLAELFHWEYDNESKHYVTYNKKYGNRVDPWFKKHVRLKKIPSDSWLKKKTSDFCKKECYDPETFENIENYAVVVFDDHCTLYLDTLYEISYQGTRLGLIDINSTKMFFDQIDGICKNLVETSFCSKYYRYSDVDEKRIH